MPDVINAGDKALTQKSESPALSINSIDMQDFKDIKSQLVSLNDSNKPLLDGLSTDDELLKQMFSEALPQDRDSLQALKQVLQADQTVDEAVQPRNASDDSSFPRLIDSIDESITSREKLGDALMKSGNVSLAVGAYEDALKVQTQNSSLASVDVSDDVFEKLDKLGVSKDDALNDISPNTVLNQLDSSDDNLRRLYQVGLPTVPDELAGLNQVIAADQSMADTQLSIATGATTDDIAAQLQSAADAQIDSRETLGDICANRGDGISAVAAYLSALKMQLNNAFASPVDRSEMYDKLEAFGVSKADAIASIVGDAEAPNQAQ